MKGIKSLSIKGKKNISDNGLKTLNISLEERISSTAKNYSDAFNSKDILEIAICFGEHNLKPAGKKQLSKLQTISMAPTQEGENSKKWNTIKHKCYSSDHISVARI